MHVSSHFDRAPNSTARQVPRPVIPAAYLIALLLAFGCRSVQSPDFARTTHVKASSQRSVSPRQGKFVNVSESAGVRFTHSNGETGKYMLVSTTASGCAFLDYDGDGLLDLLLLQGGPTPDQPSTTPREPSRLFHNRGGDSFVDVTNSSGLGRINLGFAIGAAVGDY